MELHELIGQTLAVPGARDWLLDRKITANEVGIGLLEDTRAFLVLPVALFDDGSVALRDVESPFLGPLRHAD